MKASINFRCLTVALRGLIVAAAVMVPLSAFSQSAASRNFAESSHTKPVPALLGAPSHTLLNPEMCKVKQPVASRAYIDYCLRVAPNDQPACPANSQNELLGATSSGFISYFEPLDCSWHVGEDPRQKTSGLTAQR